MSARSESIEVCEIEPELSSSLKLMIFGRKGKSAYSLSHCLAFLRDVQKES